jgi:hypothetical protein
VGIATGYEVDDPGWIPDRDKVFLHSTESRPALSPHKSPIQWVPGVLSTGVQWPVHVADHSLPSSTEVEKGGAIPPLPTFLHSIMSN